MSTVQQTASVERTLFELNRDARAALQRGDLGMAREKLRAAIALEPASLSLWLNYAAALRRSKDLAAALEAVTGALKCDPRSFSALLLKASLLEETGKTVEAGQAYGLALMFKPPGALDEPTTAALRRAETAYARYRAELATAVDRVVADLGVDAELSQSARRFIEHAAGRCRVFTSQPTDFHVPGLPSQEFYDRALFPWLEAFEQRTAAIARELQAALRDRQELFVPYVDADESLPLDQWKTLNRSDRWSALHVIQHGQVRPYAADLFPATLEALAALPQPDVAGRTPNAMFSSLQPKTRIPPHHGVSNGRLVVHLPLIVPPGCGFRVGGETRAWEVGRAWVFDDTIEHEAWNDGDAVRVILIADIWNVFMSEAERRVYRAVRAGVDQYNAGPEQGL